MSVTLTIIAKLASGLGLTLSGLFLELERGTEDDRRGR